MSDQQPNNEPGNDANSESANLPFYKQPTFYVIAVMISLFMYLQWPSRVKERAEITYYEQTHDQPSFSVTFNVEPKTEQLTDDNGNVTQLYIQQQRSLVLAVQTQAAQNIDIESLAQKNFDRDLSQFPSIELELTPVKNGFAYQQMNTESYVNRVLWVELDQGWVQLTAVHKATSEESAKLAEQFFASFREL